MRALLSLFLLGSLLLAQVPQSKHVSLITEENHSYASVIGNAGMRYYNSLAKKDGLATQYYSPMHNSLSALMWPLAGQIVTADNCTTSCFKVDNIVRHLLAQGLTWKSYQRDLPYAGFQGLYSGDYVRRHNPLIDFTDACSAAQRLNSVPFPQLAECITIMPRLTMHTSRRIMTELSTRRTGGSRKICLRSLRARSLNLAAMACCSLRGMKVIWEQINAVQHECNRAVEDA
jgi:hypothetical protein